MDDVQRPRIQEPVFVVHCERVRKTQSYILRFPINDQLIGRIKDLPDDTRKFNRGLMAWEVTTASLFALIKKYRKSTKIHFDFGSEDSRKVFIQQIKKVEAEEAEKRKFIAELDIKKEHWVKYKEDLEHDYILYSEQCHALLKEGVKLYPHQIVAAMFMNVTRNTLISHEMGLGKANPVDSKLLTPNGWIRMGDVKIGDSVIGSDGRPKRVLNVFPQGVKSIYEIFFNDGTSAQSCDEHLWNVNTYIRNWRKNPYQTKTLRQIMNEGLKFKNGNTKHYIPVIRSIEFQEKQLLINPYVLGCLLGDGCISGRDNIGFSSIDDEIIKEISIRLPFNHNLVRNGKSPKDYYLTADGKNNYINQALKKYRLRGTNSHTKFIPEDYQYSSIQQRLEFLQGILDTDGHSRKDCIVELTLASKQLIDGVQFIVESLGGIGRIHEKWITYKNERRLYYRMHIKLPPNFIPFKLKRKIETFVAPTKYLPNRAIIDIKYVGEKEALCILIDSEDHLYAVDHCILTHNTLSSILYAEMNGFQKVFVITPNSLKFNYMNEVGKFTASNSHIVNWRRNKCSIEDAKYIIVNYDFFNTGDKDKFLAKWQKLGVDVIDCVILDECQKIKNTKTNTYKNFKRVFNKSIFRGGKVSKIFLSGTPAPNRAYELYSVLNQVSPLDFPTKNFFYKYYCGMTYDFESGWGYVTDTAEQRLEELYYKIAPYTHRKRKSEVLKDLPPKVYQRVILEMDEKEEAVYEKIEEGVANEFVEHPNGNPLTTMLRLRQYVAHLKIESAVELIENILETGEKVVIIDEFKESLIELKKRLGGVAGLHTGDQPVEERAEVVRRFQDPLDGMKVFLGTRQTCNYGLTLTAASKLFLLTLPYSVGDYDQVSDRLHRIGQLFSVNIYPLIFPDTIDDYVYTSIEGKRRELVKVMDNEDYKSNVSDSVLSEVIEIIKRKHGKQV
jgi:hypothetical protein